MRIGSLCSGAGGLDMAVEEVFGARVVWHSEINKAASKVLAYRYPEVPNIGDFTAIDWDAWDEINPEVVVPVDILTGGYPCQPFSHAGQRKGTDDSRHIWPYVREAIRHLRPRYTFMENVAGHRSLGFDSVLADLAADGMDVCWTSVRAADVGAPHGRERIFMLVTDPESAGKGVGLRPGGVSLQSGGSYRFHPEGARTTRHSVNDYGPFADAIRRWESVTGLVAPAAAEMTPDGRVMVSPAFAEWLMGWLPGWVTAVPGLTSEEQLRICGNGVVPQAAEFALRYLLSVSVAA